ncbi:unnamed protein product [Onchocerca flexuosa]|uniref:Uncharacterized protein n=1 Tax=Onchocerca flexuosa TaxID=387005 RepID=A0A183HJB6_9BILA|nr:unnamed protein product [Onchocerca flexuosa]
MSHVYSDRIIRPGYDLEQEEQPRRLPGQQIQQPQENNLQDLRHCQQWLQNIVNPRLSHKYRVERLLNENSDDE